MKAVKVVIILSAALGLTAGALLAATNLLSDTRTWTDTTGKYKIRAEFVEVDGENVVLKKEDGTITRVPLEKLSNADRKWLERRQERSAASSDSGQTVSTRADATGDWPRWRGPNNDDISNETGLLKQWPAEGPPLEWTTGDLGDGFSSVVIFDGKLYTMGRKDGQTKLICRKVDGGQPVWETNVGGGDRPNCTPTVDPESKLVYGLSHGGDFLCANAETGEEVWRRNFNRDFGGRMMSGWGYSESPLIDGDRLICTPGGDKAVIVALNKRTGKVIWSCPMEGGSAGYASPVISNGGGVKQYITLVGKGLISVAADDGRPLWHYPRIANGTANVPTPLVSGDYVFGSSGYDDGGSALLKLSKKGKNVGFQEVYYLNNKQLQNHHGGMVLIGDHVYMGHGHNNGLPVCFDLKTGKPKWGPERGPGSRSAAITAADGHLYFRYEDAIMGLIEATPSGYNLKGEFKIKSRHGESWSHPVVCDKKLYLRDQHELHCYNVATN